MVLIAGTEVLRLAPALIVTDAQIAEADRLLRLRSIELAKSASSACSASRITRITHRHGPPPPSVHGGGHASTRTDRI